MQCRVEAVLPGYHAPLASIFNRYSIPARRVLNDIDGEPPGLFG
jgi:hypothetical protein